MIWTNARSPRMGTLGAETRCAVTTSWMLSGWGPGVGSALGTVNTRLCADITQRKKTPWLVWDAFAMAVNGLFGARQYLSSRPPAARRTKAHVVLAPDPSDTRGDALRGLHATSPCAGAVQFTSTCRFGAKFRQFWPNTDKRSVNTRPMPFETGMCILVS